MQKASRAHGHDGRRQEHRFPALENAGGKARRVMQGETINGLPWPR
jgi:hypothetical protein